MISDNSKFLEKPCLPVAQKLQSTAHPTCEDIQSVALLPSGIRTISTRSPSPTLNTHFLVPSLESFSKTTFGADISAFSLSFS